MAGKHAGEPEGRTDGSWLGNDDEIIQGPAQPPTQLDDDANMIQVEKPADDK